MLFDEDFIEEIIEHSPPPLVSHAALAERNADEDEDEEADPDAVKPADRGRKRGDSSVSGDRGNRTGDRDSPGERRHRGDGPQYGNP